MRLLAGKRAKLVSQRHAGDVGFKVALQGFDATGRGNNKAATFTLYRTIGAHPYAQVVFTLTSTSPPSIPMDSPPGKLSDS